MSGWAPDTVPEAITYIALVLIVIGVLDAFVPEDLYVYVWRFIEGFAQLLAALFRAAKGSL